MSTTSSRPSKVIPSLCIGYQLLEEVCSYSPRDVILYALGLGLSSVDASDEKDLRYTYEHADGFGPLPSFPVTLVKLDSVFAALTTCPGLPDFNPMMLLHGEQRLVLLEGDAKEHKKGEQDEGLSTFLLKPEGKIFMKIKIKDVLDKKKGALVQIQADGYHYENHTTKNDSRKPLFSVYVGLFIKGLGGFTGAQKPPTKTNDLVDMIERPHAVNGPPDLEVKRKTFNSQALLYRLCGDTNPLHADPAMAAIGGFSRPILHGLCTFGIAAHAVMREWCENDSRRLRSIQARFSAPVTPGDVLNIQIWKNNSNSFLQQFVFQVANETTGKVCISSGIVEIFADQKNSAYHSKL